MIINTMKLDINTEKGQQSLSDERKAHSIIENCWNINVIETPKNKISVGDGFLIKDGVIKAFFETKCRYDMTYSELIDRGSWLVTNDKIKACRTISKLLQVPFIGFLYLLPKSDPSQELLLYWKITNDDGEYVFNFEVKQQETQRSINGGISNRINAYFPVEHMRQVQSIPQ